MVRQSRREGGAEIRRGEIWLTALDPTFGTEIQKTRPCVVLSPPEINARLRIVIAAPMTTGSRPAPCAHPDQFRGPVRASRSAPSTNAVWSAVWGRSTPEPSPPRSSACARCSRIKRSSARRASHFASENHVVFALMERRARLAGELRAKKVEVRRLTRALAGMDPYIRMFKTDYDPCSIDHQLVFKDGRRRNIVLAQQGKLFC